MNPLVLAVAGFALPAVSRLMSKRRRKSKAASAKARRSRRRNRK